MIAQPTDGVPNYGWRIGRRLRRDRATDRKIVSMYKALQALATVFAVVMVSSLSLVEIDKYRAKNTGSGYIDWLGEKPAPFNYEFMWRMNHRNYSVWVGAASQEAAEEAVAERAYIVGYRLPHSWDLTHMDDMFPPASFRKRIESFEKSPPTTRWRP